MHGARDDFAILLAPLALLHFCMPVAESPRVTRVSATAGWWGAQPVDCQQSILASMLETVAVAVAGGGFDTVKFEFAL